MSEETKKSEKKKDENRPFKTSLGNLVDWDKILKEKGLDNLKKENQIKSTI